MTWKNLFYNYYLPLILSTLILLIMVFINKFVYFVPVEIFIPNDKMEYSLLLNSKVKQNPIFNNTSAILKFEDEVMKIDKKNIELKTYEDIFYSYRSKNLWSDNNYQDLRNKLGGVGDIVFYLTPSLLKYIPFIPSDISKGVLINGYYNSENQLLDAISGLALLDRHSLPKSKFIRPKEQLESNLMNYVPSEFEVIVNTYNPYYLISQFLEASINYPIHELIKTQVFSLLNEKGFYSGEYKELFSKEILYFKKENKFGIVLEMPQDKDKEIYINKYINLITDFVNRNNAEGTLENKYIFEDKTKAYFKEKQFKKIPVLKKEINNNLLYAISQGRHFIAINNDKVLISNDNKIALNFVNNTFQKINLKKKIKIKNSDIVFLTKKDLSKNQILKKLTKKDQWVYGDIHLYDDGFGATIQTHQIKK